MCIGEPIVPGIRKVSNYFIHITITPLYACKTLAVFPGPDTIYL